MRSPLLAPAAAVLLAVPAATQTACTWGSFDATRVNYSGGELNGARHSRLRAQITAKGGTIGAATATLTAAYLAGVDVFYTSFLSTGAGALSAAEQARLRAWIAAGGTLIVTGETLGTSNYETFTSQFGVTGWRAVGRCRVSGSARVQHRITQGIRSFFYCTESVFRVPTTAALLAVNSTRGPFLAVLERGTGFGLGGRILVVGDHNIFTDSFIASGQNTALAANIAKWACEKCATGAAAASYGKGHPGTGGRTPSLTAATLPKLGSAVVLRLTNTSAAATVGALIAGDRAASFPTPFGGTALVNPLQSINLAIPAAGLELHLGVPDEPALCGGSVYLQSVQRDPGASAGFAFTAGLRLTVGQ